MIKILDCTLRDGGYLNNWNFGEDNINQILNGLILSGIEYIECGFLSGISEYTKGVTLFNSIKNLHKLIDTNKSENVNYCLMLNFGENINIDQFSPDIEIRLAFKPFQLNEIKDFVRKIKNNGAVVSLNPMHISLYSEDELKILAEVTNDVCAVCLTAVDTMGVMKPYQVTKIFNFLDKILDNNISLGFHSHNNLNLSEINIETLLNLNINRDIIIDTSLNGLSRGGGMPSTEKVSQYLNKNFKKRYNISQLTKIIKNVRTLTDIKQKDTYPFYLSAMYGCHPNYAAFLLANKFSYFRIESVLKQIPEEHKIIYNKDYIGNIAD